MMQSLPRIGTTGQYSFTVGSEHVISFAGDGMPAVLSTPQLIALLEKTAREAVAPFLDADKRTVGVEIELRHLAPTPIGQQVTCTARVVHAGDRLISFQVEARDAQELIARGSHKRSVIRVGSFNRRVAQKRS